MKRQHWMALFGMALATTVGCADDSAGGPGDGGSGTEGSAESSTGGGGPLTTSGADDSSTGGGGGEAEMGDDESSTGSEPSGVLVSGEVADLNPLAAMPIPGAMISVFEDDTITDQANVAGEFELGPLPASQWSTLIVSPSDDYMGSIIPLDVREGPEQDGEQLGQLSREFIQGQIDLLEPMMPAEADLDQAIFIVRLTSKNVLEDGPVTVTMDPAPPAGTFYSPDAMGAPVLDTAEMSFVLLPAAVFFNVPPADAGTYTFSFEHATATCSAVFGNVPTMADHLTLVDVTCTAPR